MRKYLIMNIDQTDMILVLGGTDNTYEAKGAKPVFIHRKEEKRAFTAVLSIKFEGKDLLTQNV